MQTGGTAKTLSGTNGQLSWTEVVNMEVATVTATLETFTLPAQSNPTVTFAPETVTAYYASGYGYAG